MGQSQNIIGYTVQSFRVGIGVSMYGSVLRNDEICRQRYCHLYWSPLKLIADVLIVGGEM